MSPSPELLLRDAVWLRALARRLLGDAELAEDLQQEVMLAALAQPANARLGRSWLAAVARNLAAMLRRTKSREAARLRRLQPLAPVPSPDALAEEAELQQRAVAAVLALPQIYRDTVLLRCMRGLPVAAVAAAMGVPEETVRTRQKRALAMLRAQLAPVRGERRGLAALLGPLLGWGIAMKIEHIVLAAAVLLASLLVTVPLWPGDAAPVPASVAASVASMQVDVAAPVPDLVDAADAVPARIELPSPSVANAAAPAMLTVRTRWLDDHTPASGIAVLCHRPGQLGSFATTDCDGLARFTDLSPGEWRIRTAGADSRAVQLRGGVDAEAELPLARGFAIDGVVLDVDGVPVPSASIHVDEHGCAPHYGFPVAHSDAAGRFHVDGLFAGALLGARHRGFGASDCILLRRGSGPGVPVPLELRLPREGAAVGGRVVDGLGRGVDGAWVRIGDGRWQVHTAGDGSEWQRPPPRLCMTDADGRFRADSLGVGGHELYVYRAGFAPQRRQLELTGSMALAVEIVLRPGASLHGTIRDAAGHAVVGANLYSMDLDLPQCDEIVVGADGAFAFEDLPVGEVSFQVGGTGFVSVERAFTFASTERIAWNVVLQRGAAIRGRLTDAAGQPLQQWTVTSSSGPSRSTDSAGGFVLDDCSSQGETLVVRPSAVAPASTRFVGVLPGDEVQSFVVPAEAAPSAHLHGRCCATDGAPLGTAVVEIEQDGQQVAAEAIRCGQDGEFDIGPLPPGRYRLRPTHAQCVFAPVDVALRVGETRSLGRLTGAGPARLVLRLCGDAAAQADATAELRAGARRCRSERTGSLRTFPRVFPGRYRIVLTRGDNEQDGGEIDLAPGADVARDVFLR